VILSVPPDCPVDGRPHDDSHPALFMNGIQVDSLFRSRLHSSRSFRFRLLVKRAADVVIGLALLLASAPLVFIVGLLVALTSRGSIFYAGKRCGMGGKSFSCFKLRTMHVDQDELLRAVGLTAVGPQGTLLVFDADPRITRIGRWLRKLSIDELPQLWNVVKGDMSLVGPRALAVSMLEEFPRIKAVRSIMRPGITGLWQVRRRKKNATVADMIQDDMEYIHEFSLFLDLKILVQTLPKIIEPKVQVVAAEREPASVVDTATSPYSHFFQKMSEDDPVTDSRKKPE
jgi:exopolysaccharide production protein ExoY